MHAITSRYNKADRDKDRNFRKSSHRILFFFSLYISLLRSWGSPMQICRQKSYISWEVEHFEDDWRFYFLIGSGRCWMFPMTSQCSSIDGVVELTIICFTDIMESLWALPLRRLSCHMPFGHGLIPPERRWAKSSREYGLVWPLETPQNIYEVNYLKFLALNIASKLCV